VELGEVLKLTAEVADTYLIDKPYIVGGLPRDVYLKRNEIKTTDVDLTTNSSEVLRLGILLADELNVTFELSDDGHITVFTDKFDLDFSSHFVSEAVVDYLDGENKGLEEAFSRDFTINTLHQDLITRKISDPTGKGFYDINDKVIRTPVPAGITLTDDPRRIYRAINLAARYGYKIDKEITDFVLKSPELFSGESVKDKYITVKISKALKENEELTLSMLKELGLFKNVPLVGTFKDVLVKRKLLAEYLESSAIDDNSFYASKASRESEIKRRKEKIKALFKDG
jgi:tRNA nucleotidyltransferase/poly(A) polymerase